MLEAGLHFNRNNRVELGNLTGNFWDPQKSQAILLQLMVTAYLIDRAPFEMLEPVTGPRPDLWLSIDGRRVGLEITSRNIRDDVRDGINRQDLPSSWRDLYEAREDFEALWRDTISPKLKAYDGADPIVLLVWDCNFLGDVHLFMTSPLDPSSPHPFRDLLELHRKDCSPLSAFLFLPYDGQPELATCDDLGRGQPLTPRERDVLRCLFVGNPVVESGLWPPQS